MSLARILRHLALPSWSGGRALNTDGLSDAEAAIRAAESQHGGEIRVAVERALDLRDLLRGVTPRQRALQVFGELGVWDTEKNTGVLLYVLWADRDVEIVADRGYNGRVTEQEWAAVCHSMEQLFARHDARQAILHGIQGVSALIARHYPASDRDELPNRPALL